MSLLEHYVLGKRRRDTFHAAWSSAGELRDLVWAPKLEEYGIRPRSFARNGKPGFVRWKHYTATMSADRRGHNFRNPGTNRYQNLMKCWPPAARNQSILMTATPINNSCGTSTIRFLLSRAGRMLFPRVRHSQPQWFFPEVQDGGADIFTLLEQTMVRRSRKT
jgi:hypothetical protein